MQATYDPILDADQPSAVKVWLKRALLLALAFAVLGAIGYGISKLFKGGAPQKKQVTTIKLIPDTPPPPPPPPPREPPKEQPKEQPKEIKVEQPKPAEAPPAEQLKMEGPAGDGPSAFQAGAVNNDYKGGDVKTIGNSDGTKFRWYAGLLKSEIESALAKDEKLTVGQYKIQVNVWLRADGGVDRIELGKSDAPDEIEKRMRDVLATIKTMREPPPADMPQPIRLAISARSTNF